VGFGLLDRRKIYEINNLIGYISKTVKDGISCDFFLSGEEAQSYTNL
jgi:hypothetical protein